MKTKDRNMQIQVGALYKNDLNHEDTNILRYIAIDQDPIEEWDEMDRVNCGVLKSDIKYINFYIYPANVECSSMITVSNIESLADEKKRKVIDILRKVSYELDEVFND